MRIFLTGANGFIGSRIVTELIEAGHQVIGLTRSAAGAAALKAAGAEPHHGTLEDLASLEAGAAKSDGVIHTAFDHDFSRFVENCAKDRRVIEALGSALAGSDRLLLLTSGVGLGGVGHGRVAREDVTDYAHPNPRKLSEQAGDAVAGRGVKVAVMRLPQVHDREKQGLITPFIELVRSKDAVPYVGDGQNRWSAAHVIDVARLYRLAFEKQAAARYHAVAEEGVPVKEIAEMLARGLELPAKSITREEAPAYFGWMAAFADMDLSASSEWTRKTLGWEPTGPSLLDDLETMRYPRAV